MRSSTAQLLDLFQSATAPATDSSAQVDEIARISLRPISATSTFSGTVGQIESSIPPPLPSITSVPSEIDPRATALAARLASRRNAMQTMEKDYPLLLAERRQLLEKKLSGAVSTKEAARLEMVRWHLDRIEDAKYGSDLDTLELWAINYENVLRSIRDLNRELQSAARKSK
jgi:hypothetical protein